MKGLFSAAITLTALVLVCLAPCMSQATPYCEPGDPMLCEFLRMECKTCVWTPEDLNGCGDKCDEWRACETGHWVLDEWTVAGLKDGCRASEIYCEDFNEYIDYRNIRIYTQRYERWACYTTGVVYDNVYMGSYNTYYDECSRHNGGGFCFGSPPACYFFVDYVDVPWMNVCQD